jgi:hypothetical protein
LLDSIYFDAKKTQKEQNRPKIENEPKGKKINVKKHFK